MTTKDDIRTWLQEGIAGGFTHVLIVCDTFDHEDFPVFVDIDQDVYKLAAEFNGPNMTRLMEVYNLKMDIETQLEERRAFNY